MKSYILLGLIGVAAAIILRLLYKLGDTANKLDNAKMNYQALLEENKKLREEIQELKKYLKRERTFEIIRKYSQKEKE